MQVTLTQAFCKSIEPTSKTVEYADDDLAYRGLRLVVNAKGAKTFAFRSNPHYATIGKFPAVSVTAARKQVAEWKLALNAGQDPFAAIKEAKASRNRDEGAKDPTLSDAWLDYKAAILTEKSESHQRNMDRSMTVHYLSRFGARTPGDVTRREHLAFREEHEKARPSEMHQMKAYISAFYSWMSETSAYMDYVDAPPNLGKVNAARNVRTRKLIEPDDIRAYWRALDTLTPRPAALALQFKWLSNKRGIEVQRMTPDQIDWRREIWSLPDVENKAKNVVQPLTPKMQAILREALGNRSVGYVFSTTGGEKKVSLSSKLQAAAVEAAGTPYISCHDYRRTFSTQLEEMGVPSRVISLTEGHYDRGIEAHYQQATVRPLDEQLDAYRKWEQFLGVMQ